MEKLILILTLFISTLFGQSDPIIDGRFANINGNLFTVNRLSFLSSDNLTMSVLSGRFTLSQTGQVVQDFLDGTITVKLGVIKTTEQLRLGYDATNYIKVDVLDDGHTTFTTVDPDGAEADIVFIPDGNVGIGAGAVAPAALFHVVENKDGVFAAKLHNNHTGGRGFEVLAGNTTREAFIIYSQASAVLMTLFSNRTIFNDSGNDMDFRIESDNADSAFFMQGSDGKIFMEALTQQSAGGLVLEMDANTHEIYAETSTEKHKSNIRDAEIDSRDLLALELKSYTDDNSGREEVGYIAEDMAEVMPELVVFSGGEPLGIKYTKYSMVLLDLIKKQQAQIDALEKRVTALENK